VREAAHERYADLLAELKDEWKSRAANIDAL
jgi:hypothetical protein